MMYLDDFFLFGVYFVAFLVVMALASLAADFLLWMQERPRDKAMAKFVRRN